MRHQRRATTDGQLLLILAVGLLASFGAAAQDRGKYAVDPARYQALEWRNIGPFRGGRVTAVAGHADQPFTFYLGATGGGVWRTDDGGINWRNVSDGDFHTGTIGAIAVAPSDPAVIYVGTGEGPVRGVSTSHGDGVYKSTDGGRTWQHIGLRLTRHISKIVVHPADPDVVYVGAQGSPWAPTEERGVYRSTDGGATWKKVLFVDENTGVSLLSMDVTNPRVVYAAMWDHRRRPWDIESGGPGSGLYKTTDGGDHWKKLEQGLPKLMGKTGITVSPANPNRVWAMIEAVEGGVYRSDDGGETWAHVNDDPGIRDRGWYYTHIFADPQDEQTVYVLANSMVRSDDGGVTFHEVDTPHGDNHDLWINPGHPDWMIEGNDGGANVSFDAGKSWSTQDNQPTAQFYRVAVDNVFPYRLYGGQQDNSTVRIPSRTDDNGISIRHMRAVAGGESAHIAFDPDNPILIYGTSLLGSLSVLNVETEEQRTIEPYPYYPAFRPASELKYRFNWNAPVVVSRHDPAVIYHGAQVLLKSTDRGQSWTAISPDLTRNDASKQGTTGGPIMIEGAGGEHYGTIFYIAESPHDAGTLWTGSDDGRVFITRNGGRQWDDVTPRGMAESQVNAIEVSPHDPATAYIAVTRYKFNDFTPMIYKTDDYGRSWDLIVDGIDKEAFARVVREDPVRPGLLYAGTEAGMVVSFNDGDDWQPLQLDLPPVPITDLEVHEDDLVAATQGRGFWILDDITPLRQLDGESGAGAVQLFDPADALRLDGGGWGKEQAKNPPNGAIIDYLVNQSIDSGSGELKLEILTEDGAVIRTFTNAEPEKAEESLVKGEEKGPPPPVLAARRGMNRFVWDLRYDRYAPVSDTIRYVSSRPPHVAPGTYQARLTLKGQSVTKRFRVLPDPRLEPRSPEQWAEQQRVVHEMMDLVNDIHRSTMDMRSIVDQTRQLMKLTASRPQSEAIRQRGDALIEKIEAWEQQVPQPPLPDDIQDLIGFPSRLLSTQVLHLLGGIDQYPPLTEPARQRARQLTEEWAQFQAEKRQILEQDLARFNGLLEDSDVPHVVAAAP